MRLVKEIGGGQFDKYDAKRLCIRRVLKEVGGGKWCGWLVGVFGGWWFVVVVVVVVVVPGRGERR